MKLFCDYLVIGAGAASLPFIDTLLTELPDSKIILIDKKESPGGHWNDAYGFVRLHQPSLLYGVSSKQLEGNWLRCMLQKRTLPWNHRATKDEILTYFKDIVDGWVASGQVQYFPSSAYDFAQSNDSVHVFTDQVGEQHSVQVNVKLVNATLGECKVPSQTPPKFHVDKGVHFLTPNQLFNQQHGTSSKKYTVLGCGKTGMDTVVFLQNVMKVHPDNITWIIPNDVWMINRSGPDGPWAFPQAILDCDGDRDKACELLEKKGSLIRLDKTVKPTVFRFPVIGKDEVRLLQKITSLVRRGRVTSISLSTQENELTVEFDKGEPLLVPSADNHIFVNCTAPGPFNGNENQDVFASEKEIRLGMIYTPPQSISMSCIAKLEASRRKGTLDMDFAKTLLGDENAMDNDILNRLVQSLRFTDNVLHASASSLTPITNHAVFLSLVDTDPLKAYQWLQGNRLAFEIIPGYKSHVHENMKTMANKQKEFNFTDEEIKIFDLMSTKLKPLAGK